MLLLVLACGLALAARADALSDAAFPDSVFMAVIFRAPTPADTSFYLDQNGTLFPRDEVALSLLRSRTYETFSLGAAPSHPGLFQKLLGRQPTINFL